MNLSFQKRHASRTSDHRKLEYILEKSITVTANSPEENEYLLLNACKRVTKSNVSTNGGDLKLKREFVGHKIHRRPYPTPKEQADEMERQIQDIGPHSFKPQCLCQAGSPRCQCLLHFRKGGASREAKTSVSGASAPSVWIILSYTCGAIPYSVS